MKKLNTFHQYTGVACFILSVIHVVPFIYQDLAEGGSSNLKMNFKDSFEYYSGIPPLILLGLCVFSRNRTSEKWYMNCFYMPIDDGYCLFWDINLAYKQRVRCG